MRKINKFNDFINEASLRGNTGIPGEEGSGKESWLRKTTQQSDRAARDFEMQNRADIQNFMGLISRSQQLQSGHEEELSELTVAAFRELFGTMLDDVDLDFKLTGRSDVKQEMEETPDEPEQLEELLDEKIINQIQKRKILRTVQQGKGLSAKAILNLSIFKEGIANILGEREAGEYLTLLNKISNVAQFFDWMTPEDVQKRMWKTRQGFSGSCSIDFPKGDEEKQEEAENIMQDLENGEDLVNNPNAEELLSGSNTKVKAQGIDLSVLIHEAIKGIYMLVTQYSLESLYGEAAEQVIMNTDTLFDELQEIKFGRQMQDAFFKIVAENPIIIEKIKAMMDNDASDTEISSFQEIVNFRFFGKLAEIGQDDAKDFLTLVNGILSESAEAQEMCDPIIKSVIADINQEAEYQEYARGTRTQPQAASQVSQREPESQDFSEYQNLSKAELSDAIIDAYEEGDMEKVEALRKLLGESFNFYFLPRLTLNS
jgi:hypothetical protein